MLVTAPDYMHAPLGLTGSMAQQGDGRAKRALAKRARRDSSAKNVLLSLTGNGRVDLSNVDLASRAPLGDPPIDNWVEEQGGLPGYVREVARGVARSRGHGKPTSRDIATAIGQIQDWAKGGDGVTKATQAKAAKAAAQWAKMKAAANSDD